MKTLRIATVPYVNIDPFMRALSSILPTEVTCLHPSDLPRHLDEAAPDVCLLSVPEVFDRGLEPLGGASISADGPVLSVVIRSHVAVRSWQRIALDGHSIASNRLADVVVRDLLDLKPEFRVVRDPERALRERTCDAAVLIGDRALRSRGSAATHDLAALWRAFTGLPFVFAVWVPGPRTRFRRTDLEVLLADAAERSPRFVDEAVDAHRVRLGLDAATLRRYLTEHISYRFGLAERTGMEWFHRHLDPHRRLRLEDAAQTLHVGGVS